VVTRSEASALADELRVLGDLTGAPEIPRALAHLLGACVEAVPSSLGIRVTSPALGPGHAIETAGYAEATAGCRASLRLDLLGSNPTSTGPIIVTVVILAGRAGAFSEFVGGADPLTRPGVRIIRRTIDEDISTQWTQMDADLGTLDDTVSGNRIIQRAVGVLIERGHLPDEAIHHLTRTAAATDTTLLDAAWNVLRSATKRPPAGRPHGSAAPAAASAPPDDEPPDHAPAHGR
jgi:hypothetical protein